MSRFCYRTGFECFLQFIIPDPYLFLQILHPSGNESAFDYVSIESTDVGTRRMFTSKPEYVEALFDNQVLPTNI